MTDAPPPDGQPPDIPAAGDEAPAPLRLHVHVNEPWAFERENGVTSMVGWTFDHLDPDCNEWEIALEGTFLLHEEEFDRVLVGPRYVGERLDRVVDDFVTAGIRIARFDGEHWHYEMTGTLAHQRDEKKV
jgi:hypothetical protein